MTKALPFTEASIRRAVNGARSAGLRVAGVEIKPDGTVVVLSGDGAGSALPPPPALGENAPKSSKWEDVEA